MRHLYRNACVFFALLAIAPLASAAPGQLDPAFGTGGITTTQLLGSQDAIEAMAVQSDGKIVVAGRSLIPSGRFGRALARYLPDGSLDTTFGSGGKILPPAETLTQDSERNTRRAGIAVLGDGRIVYAGNKAYGTYAVFYSAAGVEEQVVTLSTTGIGSSDVAVQADGKIVIGGTSDSGTGAYEDFLVARLNADGTPDTSSGQPFRVVLDFNGGADRFERLLLQPDGKILAVGSTLAPGGNWSAVLVRLNADGTMDTGFNGTGKVLYSPGCALFGEYYGRGRAVALQPDNRILFGVDGCPGPHSNYAYMLRLFPGGTPDVSIGIDGIRPLPRAASVTLSAIAVDSKGKIVLASDNQIAGLEGEVRRLLPHGLGDPPFGPNGVNGIVTVSDLAFNALAVLPAGGLIAAGWTRSASSDRHFAIAALDGSAPVVVQSDLSGDGKPDLLWSTLLPTPPQQGAGFRPTFMWRMNGPFLTSDADWGQIQSAQIWVGLGDFNGDGMLDGVQQNVIDGKVSVHLRNDGYFLLLSGGAGESLSNYGPDWQVEAVADFNADGKPDLIYRNKNTGLAFIDFRDGKTPAGSQYLFTIDPVWQVVGIGNFNGDNQPDLMFRHATTGLAFVWDTTLSGGTVSLAGDTFVFGIDPVWQVAQIGDWNADGKPDVVFRNKSTGIVFVWYMNGYTLTTSDFITQIDPSWEIVPSR